MFFVWKYRLAMFSMPWREIINQFINCKIEPTFWFFIPLFMVYISMPLLSLLANARRRRLLWFITGCAFISISILPLTFSLLQVPFNYALNLPVTGGYVLFVLLGYILSVTEIKRPVRYALYAFALLCACLRYFGTYFPSIEQQAIVKTFWGYMNLPSVGLAVGVFIWYKHQNWERLFKTERAQAIISEVASAGFGVYLIHMFVLRHITDWFHVNIYSGWWRTLGALAVYMVSLTITLIARRIPVIRRLFP